MRSFLRYIFLSAAGKLAGPSPGIHILNGHIMAREGGDPAVFRRLLNSLVRECRLIRIEEAVDRITKGDIPDEPCIAFTFDDGFEEHYNGIAPVLEDFGINAAFFILPGFIGGDEEYRDHLHRSVFRKDGFLTIPKAPMSWEQVADLHRRGHVIGSHGMHHRPLTGLSPEALAVELDESAEAIRRETGIITDWFAFPFGRLDGISQPFIEMAKRRYRCLFSQDDHRHYFSFGGQVINRRHFEPFWPVSHVRFFLRGKRG
ncbi:MAG: polysaccharide deacetylase family protein [Bacteroidales bacterium]|nr:polysaccharide deacetylase family protein [Bacteroidales bacterium]